MRFLRGKTRLSIMRLVLCLLLISLAALSSQQSMMRSFRSLASRRASQAYNMFRRIRDPVKYKLEFAPTNLKRLLHGYYPRKPKGPVSSKVYHVHHHHYPKKKPLFVIPKPLFKLPKLPSFPKPKLPKLKLPNIKLPKERSYDREEIILFMYKSCVKIFQFSFL